MTTLDTLKPGDRVKVSGWRTPRPPGRILEMGVLKGTVLEIVRFAPLGDPIEIKVRGYHLSVRKEEAEQIEVEPC